MIRRAFLLTLAALLALPLAAHAASSPTVGRWAISTNHQEDAGKVSLLLVYEYSDAGRSGNSSWQNDVPLSDVGLSNERLAAPISPYAFKVTRDAGTFDCVGTAGGGLGAGQYTFVQSTAFGDALASRGIGRPTLEQSVSLAMSGTTIAFIDDLSKGGMKPNLDTIMRLTQHGVGPRYVAELTAAGYRITDADTLLHLRDHGVTATYIQTLKSAGLANMTANDLVRLSDHGISRGYLTALGAAGYGKLSADDTLRLADHGVRSALLTELSKAGYGHVPPDELVKLADRGVNATFIEELSKRGYTKLSVDDLVRLRDHGVTIAYIDRLQAHGYKNLPVNDLVRLHDSGV
jgi:hypothetical protein